MLYRTGKRLWLYLFAFIFLLAISQANARSIEFFSGEPSIIIDANTTDACRNAKIIFTATIKNAGSNYTLQWKKNDMVVRSDTLRYTGECFPGDIVTCTLTTPDTVIVSNSITLTSSNHNTTPVVTITADRTVACDGTPITLVATNVSNTTEVSFTWLVNGQDAGGRSDTFVIAGAYHNSIINCVMGAPACRANIASISNDIHITTLPKLVPSIKIAAQSTSVCEGSDAKFSADVKDAGLHPFYQWKVNNADAGGNSSQFTTNALKDGDIISCALTADTSEKCFVPTDTFSNTIKIKVSPKLNGGYFHITPSAQNICAGDEVSFASQFVLPGNGSFTWQINDSNIITFMPYNIFKTRLLKDGDRVRCIFKSDDACIPFFISDSVGFNVKASPVVTLVPADTVVKAGSQVQLKAVIQGTAYNYIWQPADKLTSSQTLTPLTIPLTTNVTYIIKATSDNNACTATDSANVKLIYILRMPNSFTPNGDGLNDVFRIPPPANIKLRNFSVYNRLGQIVFETKDPAKGWDGTLNGKPAPVGTYVYFIKASNEEGELFQKGTVILIR